MRIVRLAKLITMKVVEFVPCTAGSACSSGACSTCQAGANPVRSDAVGRRNMLYTNSACHALGVTNRIAMRWFGSAPANRSRTNNSCPFRWRTTSARSRSKCWSVIGWFTWPHHTSASDTASRTMNLSLGLRPVCGLVTAQNAPPSVITPSPRGVLVQRRRSQVPVHGVLRGEPEGVEPGRAPVALLGGAGRARGHASCRERSAGRPAPVLQGVDRGDDGHVHDVVYLRAAL